MAESQENNNKLIFQIKFQKVAESEISLQEMQFASFLSEIKSINLSLL